MKKIQKYTEVDQKANKPTYPEEPDTQLQQVSTNDQSCFICF